MEMGYEICVLSYYYVSVFAFAIWDFDFCAARFIIITMAYGALRIAKNDDI